MEFADWCLFLMTPCRICFLLALLLNTIQRTNCNFGLANKSLPECRELVKSRQDVTFPTASVPREKTLMVASADLTTNDFHSWCLDADEHLDIVVSNCNTSSLSQKWFRLGGQLMNLKHGRCIAATGNESDNEATLGFCLNGNNSQSWMCISEKSSTQTYSFGTTSLNSNLFLVINASVGGDILHVDLTTTQPSYWKVLRRTEEKPLAVDDSVLQNFCRIQNEFCGLPHSGVDSYIVTSRSNINRFLHLPHLLLYEHITSALRTCYVTGDTILIGCLSGHVNIASRENSYKLMTCLGGGRWSDPKPLHCIRRSCGEPQHYNNTVRHYQGTNVEQRYGDHIIYSCAFAYNGRDVVHVCGPDGKWVGDTPECKHRCEYELTNKSGLITSPNYPQPYPSSYHCKWKITVPVGLRIALWFRDFALESGIILRGTCPYDYLDVVDYSSGKKETYCGSTYPPQWFSTENKVELLLSTDMSVAGKGFKVEYTTWNDSIIAYPSIPLRNGTFPDEEDRTHVFDAQQRAVTVMKGVYLVLTLTSFAIVALIVLVHIVQSVKNRVHPLKASNDSESSIDFQKKFAQRRITAIFDPEAVDSVVFRPQAYSQTFDGSRSHDERNSCDRRSEGPHFSQTSTERESPGVIADFKPRRHSKEDESAKSSIVIHSDRHWSKDSLKVIDSFSHPNALNKEGLGHSATGVHSDHRLSRDSLKLAEVLLPTIFSGEEISAPDCDASRENS